MSDHIPKENKVDWWLAWSVFMYCASLIAVASMAIARIFRHGN